MPDFVIRAVGADKAAAHLYDTYAPNKAKQIAAEAGQIYTDWASNNPNIAETSKFGLNVATSVAGVKAGLPKKAGRGHDDFAGATNHNIPLTEEYFRQQYGAGKVVQGGGSRLDNLERKQNNAQINDVSKFNHHVKAEKRLDAYLKYSPSWEVGSFSDTYMKFTPNSKGIVSSDKVKTRYTSQDGRYTLIKDNENNYFRLFDNQRKQYLDKNGHVVSTGNLQGKDAKDFLQKQTHFRNID